MKWYYVLQDRRLGPVSAPQIEELRRTGLIQDDTPVWHAGMKDWQPLAEAVLHTPLPSGHKTCGECGGFYPENELLRIEDGLVCGDCKPVILQRLRESISAGLNDRGLWRHKKMLVMSYRAKFPELCVRCNAPTQGFQLRWVLSCAPRGRFLIVARRVEIFMGVCERHRKLHRRGMIIGVTGFLLGSGVICLAAVFQPELVGIGVLLMLAGVCVASITGIQIRVQKSSDDVTWLRGCGKPFLAALPEWKGGG